MTVKRYLLSEHNNSDGTKVLYMKEHPNGDHVAFKDYNTL